MLRNSNNIYFLKLNVLVSRITEKYFKHATEIGTGMSAEGQIVTKTPFSAVLKCFPSFFLWYIENIFLTNIWLQSALLTSIYISS